MEANELHRGRLIDHVQLVVRDLSSARTFYAAVLGALGIPIGGRHGGSTLAQSSTNSPSAKRTPGVCSSSHAVA